MESPCRLFPSPGTSRRLSLPDHDWEKLAPTSCLRAPSECTLLQTNESRACFYKDATRCCLGDRDLQTIVLIPSKSFFFNHSPTSLILSVGRLCRNLLIFGHKERRRYFTREKCSLQRTALILIASNPC